MHLEIDRKAPPRTYKERIRLQAACAVLLVSPSSILPQSTATVLSRKLEPTFPSLAEITQECTVHSCVMYINS